MINIQMTDSQTPICPHCNMELTTVSATRVKHLLGRSYMYFCPQCRKVLGFSHRKGFWMG